MNDKYKHDPDAMSSSASNFEKLIDDYNKKLQEIQNLINSINSSPSWKDTAMKDAYNSTCNGYMKIHNNRALNFSFNITKLKEKAKRVAEFEEAYSKRW